MAASLRFILTAALALTLVACDSKTEAPVEKAETKDVSAPADPNDNAAWKEYLQVVVMQNLKGMRGRPFMYYLPSQSAPVPAEGDDAAAAGDQVAGDSGPSLQGTSGGGEYDRLRDSVMGTLQRGVLPKNLIAFGSPDSKLMADLVVDSFAIAPKNSLQDVRILFIGNAEDRERVEAVVKPTGAEFVFHEAK